jgi:hypothetical protein
VIRTNLSTRPFYNEQAVHLWLGILGAIVIAASIFNVTRIIRDSRSGTQLGTQASQDEARARDLRASAQRLRATVDPKEIELASTDARQANELIDRRTFSWTELLNLLETTMPDDVRIASVRPEVDDKRGIVLRISLIAKTVEDIDLLMERLDHSGAFLDPIATQDRVNDDGQLEAVLDTVYVPKAGRIALGGSKRR